MDNRTCSEPQSYIKLYQAFHSHHDMIANQNEFRDEIRYTYKRKRVKSTHSDFIIIIIILGVL